MALAVTLELRSLVGVSSNGDSRPRIERALGPAIVGASAVLYVATAARTILGGDNGEFATLAATGGVAHPPGYPLYVLWLRAMRWLPGVSPAHRAALATAILGVAAIWVLQRAAHAWGASARAAALASAIFATSSLSWMLATEAEVFSANALLALAIVWASAPDLPLSGARRTAVLGLLAGLGLAVHHSIVLLAPLGLFAAIVAVRDARGRRIGAVAAGLGGLAVGLLPYLQLVLGARAAERDGVWAWGDTRDVHGLLQHFFRADYGTLQLGVNDLPKEPGAQLVLLSKDLFFDFFGLPAFALLAAVATYARTRRRPRGATLALLAAFLLAGPVFVSRFNTPPRGIGASIVERFHLLPGALACVLAAIAIGPILARVRVEIAALATLAVAAFGALLAYPDVREHHRPTVQLYAENVMGMLPPNAIVIGSGDHRMGAFLYERAIGTRPDVVFINPWLLLGDWYAERASRQLGISVVRAHDGVVNADALFTQLLGTGRPVFVTDWFAPGVDKLRPSYPLGPVIRLVESPAELPAPAQLASMNDAKLATFVFEDDLPERGTWAGDLQADYARPWVVLQGAFLHTGDLAAAERAGERVKALTPR